MQPRGRGVIVNNASVLGWRAQKEQAHYAAAKAGVMALTRCAALEAAEYGVRINAVAPSIALHDVPQEGLQRGTAGRAHQREAFGRAAEVWEVANVMIFLASDYASYMTGEVSRSAPSTPDGVPWHTYSAVGPVLAAIGKPTWAPPTGWTSPRSG
jgi:3-oxoacyl-[acyl-carrier protein] reductase